MKIAVIAHSLFPIIQPYAGGLEMITHLLCNELIKLGHQVDLYAHRDSKTLANLIPFNHDGMKLEQVKKYIEEQNGLNQSFIEDNLSYAKVMNEIKNGSYDIVHNHSLHYIPMIMGNDMNVPFITTIHTPPFPWLQMAAVSVKKYCNQTFTVVSEKLGETWSDFITNPVVVYNGVDIKKWKIFKHKDLEYFMCCGRICVEKGIEEAIQFSLSCNTPLRILGPISDPDYFERSVAPYLLNPLISYHGHCTQSEIRKMYQKAIATLFFSTWEEPYGLVIAESLATGTPVISYNIGAAPEILTTDCGILLTPGTKSCTDTVFKRIQSLTAQACRNRAVEFCSHYKMIKGYENLYDHLLSHKPEAEILSA